MPEKKSQPFPTGTNSSPGTYTIRITQGGASSTKTVSKSSGQPTSDPPNHHDVSGFFWQADESSNVI